MPKEMTGVETPIEEVEEVKDNVSSEETTQEEVDEGTEVEEEGNDLPEDYGEPITLDDIMNDPKLSKEIQKLVDKKTTQAIKTYQKNHDVDVEQMVAQKVAEQVNEVRFNAQLDKALSEAGVIDQAGYKAHLDINVLKECYDPETNTIEGMDELIAESKKSLSHLFKQEGKPTITGMAQTKFGASGKQVQGLRGALKEKYGM